MQARGPKWTISYQKEAWIIIIGIRAYTEPKVWSTRMLDRKRTGRFIKYHTLIKCEFYDVTLHIRLSGV